MHEGEGVQEVALPAGHVAQPDGVTRVTVRHNLELAAICYSAQMIILLGHGTVHLVSGSHCTCATDKAKHLVY